MLGGMVRSCGAVAARRGWRTTPPPPEATHGGAGGAGLAPPTAHPTPHPLIGGARCARFDGGGRAHRACTLCAVPCAVPVGPIEPAARPSHRVRSPPPLSAPSSPLSASGVVGDQ